MGLLQEWSGSVTPAQNDGTWSRKAVAPPGCFIVQWEVGTRAIHAGCGAELFTLNTVVSLRGRLNNGLWLQEVKAEGNIMTRTTTSTCKEGHYKLHGKGAGWFTNFLGIGDGRDPNWELAATSKLSKPCKVTGYQLRTCDWVGSAKFQFTSFAEGAAGDSMSHTDQDRQENVLDASPDQEHTISEGGSWAASHTSEEAEAALAFSDDDVMQLNVGGTMFMTTRRTLTQVPESKLAAMFQQEPQHLPTDSTGATFLDHDPGSFSMLLKALRMKSINRNVEALKSLQLSENDLQGLQLLVKHLGLSEWLGQVGQH